MGELVPARVTVICLACILLAVSTGMGRAHAQTGTVEPRPGLVLTRDTTFTPGEYHFDAGEGMVIGADGITVDGNGAIIVGPGTAGNPASFAGTGIQSEGHSNVTLKDLTVKGFDLGLKVVDGASWTITGNDFSDNYTDPSFGWGDGPPFGAVRLERVKQSTITRNRGQRVWNGLNLRYSDDNTITGNDFSTCSNVCLKMWRASRNLIRDNTMSYGIRIDPGETHARDSTSALIETGSNDNKLYNNDFTHGGDGVFIRPLNGFLSTGNYFEGNDASYAHNNAWECWSSGNTFVNNKANYSSYGFWLGGSDHTVLIGNEAAYNGTVNANAPEPFGNAGISVVHGSSSHSILQGNNIHDNKSVGLAFGYKVGYEAFHWIIQQNRVYDNTTYGIYMRDARWIDMAGNALSGNALGDVKRDRNVTDVFERDATMQGEPPRARASTSTQTVYVGEPVTFDASASTDPNALPLTYRWDLGDGDIAETATVSHRYLHPGFYRVGVSVNNGKLADLAWSDVYVVEKGEEIGTEGVTPVPGRRSCRRSRSSGRSQTIRRHTPATPRYTRAPWPTSTGESSARSPCPPARRRSPSTPTTRSKRLTTSGSSRCRRTVARPSRASGTPTPRRERRPMRSRPSRTTCRGSRQTPAAGSPRPSTSPTTRARTCCCRSAM